MHPATSPTAETVEASPSQATASTGRLRNLLLSLTPHPTQNTSYTSYPPIPTTSPERLAATANDKPLDLYNLPCRSSSTSNDEKKTVLYLAYGSNLAHSTFEGSRGIRPLSQINVQVPSLRLTFDLPGIPYSEPCFANTGIRHPSHPSQAPESEPQEQQTNSNDDSATPTAEPSSWTKGLIGVVYEVTLADYTHIIATEGGGSAYNDILIPCHPLPPSPTDPVPSIPLSVPFMAHTLFCPPSSPRIHRPDPDHAQASPRYLALLTVGAKERDLPLEYRRFLESLQPYTPTSQKQELGRFIFLMMWGPFVAIVLALQKMFQDERGRSPKWLVWASGALFEGMWGSYDNIFLGIFGEGERTVKTGKGEDARRVARGWAEWRRKSRMLRLGDGDEKEKAGMLSVV
ncbi:hypothetical protein K402DRAFT_380722 [Aulographum hederae CBS 113979]|uniref:gamma-glutamylcyclotransferase n=1 Tax=Aulographum hederae CBS 113979 TaxID=1176131 RepID=A0A6G1GUN2_9PEZI|nr:hypothetical protein K402DRAFT_380722 [Aulographum hederae CBS 113979]